MKNEFGRELSMYMKARSYTVEQLAIDCGISQAEIRDLKAGRLVPTDDVFWALTRVLGALFSPLNTFVSPKKTSNNSHTRYGDFTRLRVHVIRQLSLIEAESSAAFTIKLVQPVISEFNLIVGESSVYTRRRFVPRNHLHRLAYMAEKAYGADFERTLKVLRQFSDHLTYLLTSLETVG